MAAASPSPSESAAAEGAECPACGASLEFPLGCSACGHLVDPGDRLSPFAVFGLEPSWKVDPADLKRRLLRVSRLSHPDFHGTAPPEIRALAEANSARANGAYEVVLDDFLRADWLVRHLGGPSDSDERQMPQAFLMEVLEWNEAMEEAESSPPDSPERETLESLSRQLHEQHDEILEELGASLDPLPDQGDASLSEVRRSLNAVRYLSRALLRIRDLRFGAS